LVKTGIGLGWLHRLQIELFLVVHGFSMGLGPPVDVAELLAFAAHFVLVVRVEVGLKISGARW